MNNRFTGCKTLGDLYKVFVTAEGQDYSDLSNEELERVAVVFEANKPETVLMPDVPLTEAGYTLVWEVTIETVENFIMEEDVMNNTVNNGTINNETVQEETKMGVKESVDAAVAEMMDKFKGAKENILHEAGKTKEEYIQQTDDSLNTMKAALGSVVNVLDTVLGYSVLKDSVIDMMEAGCDGKTSKKDLFAMAKRCRELIDAEIENLEFWGDEESFKKAVQLKALTEGARGKSVFEAFVVGVIWVVKTVYKKIKAWVAGLDENSILGAVCRSIAGFAGVLRAGVKIVWNAAKFAVSFIVAGAVKLIDWVVRAVQSLIEKVKNWKDTKDEVIEEEVVVDTEDFEDDVENI